MDATLSLNQLARRPLTPTNDWYQNLRNERVTQILNNERCVKADFQYVLRTLESLFMFFVLLHVRHHKM